MARAKEKHSYDASFKPAKAAASAGPAFSLSELKSDAAARKQALRRHQIQRISPVGKANPNSKNTDNVFTASDNTRYARTDLYRPTIPDRFHGLKRRASTRSHQWWDKNKKTIVVATVASVAGFLIYSAWKNAQLEKQLARARSRRSGSTHHAGYGYWPFIQNPYELQSFYNWPSEEFMGYPPQYASWW